MLASTLLLSLAATPAASAVEPLFGAGYSDWSPVAQGTYTHYAPIWWNAEHATFERSADLTVGQIWAFDDEYDVMRAFVVFELPSFKGVVTRDQVGIPPHEVPEITTLRVTVTGGILSLAGASFLPSWWATEANQPLDVRLAALPAAAMIDGTIDPETAFNGLGQGYLINGNNGNLSADPQDIYLNQAFANLMNNRDAGPLLLSLTLPFVPPSEASQYYEVASLQPEVSLRVTFDGYPPFPAVPEPSTYALAGAALCLGIVLVRRRRSKPVSPAIRPE